MVVTSWMFASALTLASAPAGGTPAPASDEAWERWQKRQDLADHVRSLERQERELARWHVRDSRLRKDFIGFGVATGVFVVGIGIGLAVLATAPMQCELDVCWTGTQGHVGFGMVFGSAALAGVTLIGMGITGIVWKTHRNRRPRFGTPLTWRF